MVVSMNKNIKKRFLYLNKKLFSVIISLALIGCSSLPKKTEPVTARLGEARKTFALGEQQYSEGLYQSAYANFDAALVLFGSLDERDDVIRSYLAMGRSLMALGEGESESALSLYGWALSLAEDLGDSLLVRDAANHLGNYYLAYEDLAQVDHWFSYGDVIPDGESRIFSDYYRLGGTAAKRRGDYPGAIELYNKAIAIDEALEKRGGDSDQLGTGYYLTGSAYSLMGDWDMAERSLLTALDKDRYYENLPGIAADLNALGKVLEKSGRPEEALFYYRRAYLAWIGLKREDKMSLLENHMGNMGEESFLIPPL